MKIIKINSLNHYILLLLNTYFDIIKNKYNI